MMIVIVMNLPIVLSTHPTIYTVYTQYVS